MSTPLADRAYLGKVVPLGTSLTLGSGSFAAYRDHLKRYMMQRGFMYDYAGTVTTQTGDLDNWGMDDKQSEGYSGKTTLQLRDIVDTTTFAALNGDWYFVERGANDNASGDNDADRQQAYIQSLVNALASRTRFGAKVRLLTCTMQADASSNGFIRAVNQGIYQFMANGDRKGMDIDVWPVGELMEVPTHDMDLWSDTTHFNHKGYRKMAQVIAAFWLKELGADPRSWMPLLEDLGVQSVPFDTSATNTGVTALAVLSADTDPAVQFEVLSGFLVAAGAQTVQFFNGGVKSASAASVDATANTITFASDPGFATGDKVMNTGSTANGITTLTPYWVNRVSATEYALYTTRYRALADSNRLDITGSGTPGPIALQNQLHGVVNLLANQGFTIPKLGIVDPGNALILKTTASVQTGGSVLVRRS